MDRLGCLCIAALIVMSTAASGDTFVVDLGGGGDFLTIQEGLDAASPGDTVLIAPGVYTGPQNRDVSYAGKDLFVMPLLARDPVIIDCQGLGRGFVFNGGEGPGAVLDGIEIRNGDASS